MSEKRIKNTRDRLAATTLAGALAMSMLGELKSAPTASAALNETIAVETPASAIKQAETHLKGLELKIKRLSDAGSSEAMVYSRTTKNGHRYNEYVFTHKRIDGQGHPVYDSFSAEEPVNNPKSKKLQAPTLSYFITGMPHANWKNGDGFVNFMSLTHTNAPNAHYELFQALDGDFTGGISYNLSQNGRNTTGSGQVSQYLDAYTSQARSIVAEANNQ